MLSRQHTYRFQVISFPPVTAVGPLLGPDFIVYVGFQHSLKTLRAHGNTDFSSLPMLYKTVAFSVLVLSIQQHVQENLACLINRASLGRPAVWANPHIFNHCPHWRAVIPPPFAITSHAAGNSLSYPSCHAWGGVSVRVRI